MRSDARSHLGPWAGTLALGVIAGSAAAIDGGIRYINPQNGYGGFEIITQGDDVPGDGFAWSMPGVFDGLGAQRVGDTFLRIQINHEISGGNATVSEVLLDLPSLQKAIANVLASGETGGVGFVTSARQAYGRWTPDGGATWNPTEGPSETDFSRFCSSQSYAPNTFGIDRGFVDDLYITGEEVGGGRLFVLDITNRDFYQLSGYTGSAAGAGIGGMPFDAWENAALIDTGETAYIALLLSPDGGSQELKLFIGEKGKDAEGNPSDSFLARNGLAYGQYFFLNAALPVDLGSTVTDGFFDATAEDALRSSKLEDVDTSPSSPDLVVLGDQNSGTFIFDFDVIVDATGFDAAASSFTITKVANDGSGAGVLGDADNVDWTAPASIGGVDYPEGIVLINEDNGDGEVWMMSPDGSNPIRIGDTIGNAGTESSGIIDVSELLDFEPGNIILTVNQGSPSSLTLLAYRGVEEPEPDPIFNTIVFQQGIDGYAGTLDKEIRSSGGDEANGEGPEISVDGDDGSPGLQPNHGLVRFESIIGNALGQIAPGTRIDSAVLKLNVINPGSGFDVHEMIVAWDELTTWADLGGDGITPGIDAAADPIISLGADNGSENVPAGTLSIDLTTLVQGWIDGEPNFGVGLVALPNGTNGIDFTSSETTAGPMLEIRSLLPGLVRRTFRDGADAYAGTADTMIAQAEPDAAFGDATSISIDADDPSGSGNITQGFIRFADLFGSGSVPTDRRIVRAWITVTGFNPGNGASVHRMLVPWDEAVTWNGSFGGDGVQADDVEAKAMPDAFVSGGTGEVEFDVTDAITAWQVDPTSNLGWVLLPVGGDGWDLFSSEADATSRPTLTIVFEGSGCDPDGDGVIGFSDLLLLLNFWGDCSNCPDSACCVVDLVSDGSSANAIDFADLLELLTQWGPCSEG